MLHAQELSLGGGLAFSAPFGLTPSLTRNKKKNPKTMEKNWGEQGKQKKNPFKWTFAFSSACGYL